MRKLTLAVLLAVTVCLPAAYAFDSSATDKPAYLASVRAKLAAKQYDAAATELREISLRLPNADVFSLLGHALWKSGDRTQGMDYYNKALALDASHKGALEYQGELYVALGQIDKAKANLAKLKRLCLLGCEEEEDLDAAIKQATKGH